MWLGPSSLRRLVEARERLADDRAPSIRELAEGLAISREHFIRLFEAAFGTTPHQFRIAARLERAKQLLARSDRSVTEICFAVGFASLGSFSALFARRVGISPSAYRRAHHEPPPACLALMTQLPAGAFRTSGEAG